MIVSEKSLLYLALLDFKFPIPYYLSYLIYFCIFSLYFCIQFPCLILCLLPYLLDLLVLEALLQTLHPLFVPDLSVLGEAVVPEILRIAIVPVKHVLHTCRLYVLPEPLLPSELGLELWVILLDQVELHYGLVGFQVRQVVRRLG